MLQSNVDYSDKELFEGWWRIICIINDILTPISQVMSSFVFLLVGFALSFSLVFPASEFFNSPWDSFVRTVVMMIGEFEYTSTYTDLTDVRRGDMFISQIHLHLTD